MTQPVSLEPFAVCGGRLGPGLRSGREGQVRRPVPNSAPRAAPTARRLSTWAASAAYSGLGRPLGEGRPDEGKVDREELAVEADGDAVFITRVLCGEKAKRRNAMKRGTLAPWRGPKTEQPIGSERDGVRGVGGVRGPHARPGGPRLDPGLPEPRPRPPRRPGRPQPPLRRRLRRGRFCLPSDAE